jgi:hypothetical protein
VWAGSGFGTPVKLLRAWTPRSCWLRAPAPETRRRKRTPSGSGHPVKVGRPTDGLAASSAADRVHLSGARASARARGGDGDLCYGGGMSDSDDVKPKPLFARLTLPANAVDVTADAVITAVIGAGRYTLEEQAIIRCIAVAQPDLPLTPEWISMCLDQARHSDERCPGALPEPGAKILRSMWGVKSLDKLELKGSKVSAERKWPGRARLGEPRSAGDRAISAPSLSREKHRRLDFRAMAIPPAGDGSSASAGFLGLRQGIDHHGKTIVLPFRLRTGGGSLACRMMFSTTCVALTDGDGRSR